MNFRKLILLGLASFVMATSFGQSNNKENDPDFLYEVESQIEKTTNIGVNVMPVSIGVSGNSISFGAGLGVEATDLFGKLAIDGSFVYNYYNYALESVKPTFSYEDYNKLSTYGFDIGVGYSFLHKSKTVNERVKLKQSGRTSYVAYLPVKRMTRLDARLGLNFVSSYTSVELDNVSVLFVDNAGVETLGFRSGIGQFRFETYSITVGVKYRTSRDARFNTDKYGEKIRSKESYIYADVMIPVTKNVHDVYVLDYDQTNTSEVSLSSKMGEAQQTSLVSSLKRLPVGFRIGYVASSRKKHGFLGKMEAGITPGYYGSIIDKIYLQLGIAYRLGFNL